MSGILLPVVVGAVGPGVLTIGLFAWQNRWKLSVLELNVFKDLVATSFLIVIVLATTRSFSSAYTLKSVGYMMISSFLGVVVSDVWWLLSMDVLGARKMIAVDTIKPFVSIILGAMLLGDKVSPLGIGGIFVTSAGIFMVNNERASEESMKAIDLDEALELAAAASPVQALSLELSALPSMHGQNLGSQLSGPSDTLDGGEDAPRFCSRITVAYMYAVGNVILDIYAATLTVQFRDEMSIADVNLIRFGFGGLVLALVVAARPHQPQPDKGPMTKSDWRAVTGGVVFVTVLAPLATVYTYFTLPLAVAVSLNSLAPLWSLPVAACNGEVINPAAAIGAIFATGGVVMLVAGL